MSPRFLARRRLLASAALAPVVGMATEDKPLRVIYPRMLERPEQAFGYRVLGLALQHAGQPYELQVGDALMSNKAAWQALQQGRVDVVDNSSAGRSPERVDLVPVPIDFGLAGCRMLLGRREVLHRLRGVRRVEDLRGFVFGQGFDWTDGRILRNAGLRVEEADFSSLLRMLQGRRFDLLPLGCDEAHAILERERDQAPDVQVDEGVGLFYPYPRIFFLTRGNTALQAALLRGLKAAREDGSLAALLEHTPGIGPVLTGKRPLPKTLIGLPNPWLPAELRGLAPEQYHPALRATLRALQQPTQG
ncbi:hypothetical protein SNE35_03035 [Paucibacter sp. R3-3]|uniref:Solute-binding protein family 3/N-terminal domain-containing protein n=1 Tax=Roseateles agri TaxID=3098619 RepID=A0ABU5DB53_9BURK|nr:hypothetical protein [Paucibacter sp. R3-3]MDY0743458.1 hypothetical protein [Paucibacter sp. R3-3]